MSDRAWAYVAGGAGLESTMAANRAAFDRWRIVPRVLVDTTHRDLGVTLFGRRLPSPLLLSPIGVLEMAHAGADVAVARAASLLHHGVAEGHAGHALVSYVLVFFAIWWAWMNFTWFASAYDCDDVPYRLAVFLIRTPPLAGRPGDLPELVEKLMERMAEQGPARRLAPEAMEKLAGHGWPGNVRELQHVLERAAILAEDRAVIGTDEIEFGEIF